MACAFPYQPLEKREIRLITLYPAPETGDPCPVVCDVFHALLDAGPQYEALSYTWGDDAATTAQHDIPLIRCSGSEIRVTRNLFAAFKRLRNASKPRILWIDAICINQNDVEEKGTQVALMNKIFAGAEQVIVWLGEEEDKDGLAFETILRLNDYFRHSDGGFDSLPDLWHTGECPGELPKLGNPGWAALGALMRRRWFERVWVVQEVVLAENALVVCGSLSILWSQLEEMARSITASNLRSLLAFTAGQQGLQTIGTIMRLRASIQEQVAIKLGDILVSTLRLKATDPRDKIYSLLGIVSTSQESDDEIPIDVDYTILTERLFRDLAIYYLTEERECAIWSFVDHGSLSNPLHTPSWVPNWVAIAGYRNAFSQFENQFKSTRELRPICQYSADEECQIVASGVKFDQTRATVEFDIGKMTTFIDDRIDFELVRQNGREWLSWLQQCETMHDSMCHADDTNKISHDALWRTLMCNTTTQGQVPGPEYQDSFDAWCTVLKTAFAPSTINYDIAKAVKDDVASGLLSSKGSLFETAMSVKAGGRVFCTTEGGRIGMVPQATKEGDIICLFLGAITPFVIRPDGEGAYYIIGECYVHGVMYGELLDQLDFHHRIEEIRLK